MWVIILEGQENEDNGDNIKKGGKECKLQMSNEGICLCACQLTEGGLWRHEIPYPEFSRRLPLSSHRLQV